MKKQIKSNLLTFGKGLFTATSLYVLLRLISLQKLSTDIENIDINYVLVALSLTFLQLPLRVLKWTKLVRIHSPEFLFKDGMISYLKGITLATISPFAIGELTRGVFVEGGPKTELTAKTFLDKFFDFMTVAFLSLIGLLFHLKLYHILPVVFILYTIFLYYLKEIIQNSIKMVPQSFLERPIIQRLTTGFVMVNRKDILFNSGISMLYSFIFYSQTYLLLLALDSEASPCAIPLFPLVTLSTIIPITISGLGIREWTAVILLKQVTIAASVAFNCFFLQFLLTNILLSIVGVFCFLVKGGKTKSVSP